MFLKKKESLYDKLYETVLRNNEILKQKNEIENLLKNLNNLILDIFENCENVK